MNSLRIFENEEFGQVRTVTIDGEPWFVGKDVAAALGYSNTKDAIGNHVDEDDKQIIQRSENTTFEIPNRGLTIINESGMYSLIFGSKLESAKQFKHWVTSEVIPAIRKTGHYETPQYKQQAKQRDLTKDDYIRAASIISGCRNERLPYVMAFLEQAGLEMPQLEQVQKMQKTVSEIDGLADDGKLEEYAEQLMEAGIKRKTEILVINKDFNDFCSRHGIAANKFRKWLHQNGYTRAWYNNTKGRINYTTTKWIAGNKNTRTRCVVFEL